MKKILLIAITANLTFFSTKLRAQDFQTPTDLVLNKGNPFDDPNFIIQRETPEGICGGLPALTRDDSGLVTACFPFDPKDPNECTSHYRGCYDTVRERDESLRTVEDANKGAVATVGKLTKEIALLKSKLKSCEKTRGRRC